MSESLIEQLRLLPDYLGAHLRLTLLTLGTGIAISVPLALFASKVRSLRWPAMTAAGVVQTIPSLALLALMVPLAGFGFWPAFVALTLYSMLPILRNTLAGIGGVDPRLIEAARACGMTKAQSLFRVEIPLALPVMLAGIRTAAVWVVGTATLSTPVGQTSLGNYIFSGLQTRTWSAVMTGVIAAAVLAIVLDLLIGGIEQGLRVRRSGLVTASATALVLLFVGGLLAPSLIDTSRSTPIASNAIDPETYHRKSVTSINRPIRIGAKTFTEQYILASCIDHLMRSAGFATDRLESLGSSIAFDALRSGELDVYVDYSGTLWANYMKRNRTESAWKTLQLANAFLIEQCNLRNVGPLGFENAYALAMRRDRAKELGIRSVTDLARQANQLTLGADYEFLQRPDWATLRQAYALNFGDVRSFDNTFVYEAVRSGEIDVIVAFSSDGRIPAYDLAVLDDPKEALPPYDAMLLVSDELSDDTGVIEALRPMVRSISDARMRLANKAVDVDGRSPDEVGAELAAELIEKDRVRNES